MCDLRVCALPAFVAISTCRYCVSNFLSIATRIIHSRQLECSRTAAVSKGVLRWWCTGGSTGTTAFGTRPTGAVMGWRLSPQASDASSTPTAAPLSAHCKPIFSWSLLVRITECHSHALQTQVCRQKSAQMKITPDCRCLIGTSWRVAIALRRERQRAPLIRDTCDPRSLRHPDTTLSAVAILLSPHMNISLSHTDVHITDAIGAPLTACTTSMYHQHV